MILTVFMAFYLILNQFKAVDNKIMHYDEKIVLKKIVV